jgi:GNAT superfamily N-acetyltransferase
MTFKLSAPDLVFKPLDQVPSDARQAFSVHVADTDRRYATLYRGLTSYFRGEAIEAEHADRRTRTHVALFEDRVVGYVTTHVHIIDKRQPTLVRKTHQTPYTALHVTHIGVQDGFQRRSIGRQLLLRYGIGAAAVITKLAGCRYVYLQAIRPSVPFYERLRFVTIPRGHADQGTTLSVPMVLDLATAGTALDLMASVALQNLGAR